MEEADLYLPLKDYLQAQNYEVKAEIGNCDVFAVRDNETPLICELKLNLNLTLILQAVDRLALTPLVYIGVPKQCSALRQNARRITKLLRMLGLGLITIDPVCSSNPVQTLLDPGEYKPRFSKRRQTYLLAEFEKRIGDPNLGGSDTRKGRITAYRQRAVKIALLLDNNGPTKASEVARQTDDTKARTLLYRDVYGWFESTSRGIYQLSPRGRRELPTWSD